MIVGRSVNPVGETGARILHLGIVADDGDRAKLVVRDPEAPEMEVPR